ncbi:MAG: DUF4197 domain-containing protein [Fulvivirga sp.]|nr:DUF4197 domain-containing protein [Fulvivirga sp.]
MIKLKYLLIAFIMAACTSAQINQTLGTINDALGEEDLTRDQVVAGLKEALVKGTRIGTDQASQLDGYYKHPVIKIPFPPDVQRVEEKLRQIGLDDQVDRFIKTLNRGAEEAAKEAAPIFVNAIKSMTIEDAWGILRGEDDAATQYLIRTTSSQLKSKFRPVISKALDQTNATRYYGDIVSTYNKIPFVDEVNPELDDYATDKAIEGLFYLVAKEEKKIREDPLARTTDLLKKVFAAQD